MFYQMVSILGSKCFSIHDAKIISSKTGYTANTFVILDQQGKAINDSQRALEISQSLTNSLLQKNIKIDLKPLPKKLEQFNVPTQVSFIETKTRKSTLLEIVALDHPGLLARFARIFQECKLHIHSAKITTFGEKAEDVFIVSNSEEKALNEAEKKALKKQLCDEISSQ